MDPYNEGRSAWHDDIPIDFCPYPNDSEESADWRAGWLQERDDNGQFGVGA